MANGNTHASLSAVADNASPRWSTREQALEILLQPIRPTGTKRVALEDADGCTLAEDVVAQWDTPPFDASAMDGYALNSDDAGKQLPVTLRIAAGDSPTVLPRGSCARIFTGAPLPEGSDCIVIQEEVKERDGYIIAPTSLTSGEYIRKRGRASRKDTVLIPTGTQLNAAAIGVAASQGYAALEVRKKPKIALFSTGSELVTPGKELSPGQIFDSNRYMLAALLKRFGFDVVWNRSIKDDLTLTEEALEEAAQIADVVVTMGGVSVGEEDHVRHALTKKGELQLWKLNIQPGKPLALGKIHMPQGEDVPFIGLAGNPVSSYVGAWLFLRPLAGALLASPTLKELPTAVGTADFNATTGARWNYMRARYHFAETDQDARVEVFQDQDSSLLGSCLYANALAIIPPHHEVNPGDKVHCLLLQTP